LSCGIAPICEVEFELKSVEIARLFELALALCSSNYDSAH
jgi:inorganic triphosphatase YgiF